MPFNKKENVLISFVLVAVLMRLLPHPPNVAPITAVALFAGTFFDKKHWAVLMPLLAMIMTDIFLGFSMITPVVYLSFLAITAVGIRFKKMNISTILLSSLVFFVLSNLGVWVLYYPLTAEGLTTCFTLAIPFFINSMLGDIFFSALLLFGYRFAAQRMQLA
ncbi:MAG: hypothetical protein O2810_02210 [Bacteroidetes bacterium]|nr:hypothetical protein [Bacteroidota bacterium]MDA0888209.1 hypothetical protein [Bacteroidota bacterium]MDA1084331.1 hypothetical protein [Bacteroidota bacterium]